MGAKVDPWRLPGLVLLGAVAALWAATFLDYGQTNDEVLQANYGDAILRWFGTLFRDRDALGMGNLHFYGGFFDLVAQAAVRLSPLPKYDTRHLINAAFGLAGLFFCWRVGTALGGYRAGFFSALFLTMTPVYYGHSFNNPKDIPFAAMSAMALDVLVRALPHMPILPSVRALKLAVALGLALAIRSGGIFLLGFVGLFWAIALLNRLAAARRHPEGRRRLVLQALFSLSVAFAVAYLVMILFWPYALDSPHKGPFRAIRAAIHFDSDGLVLFDGELIRSVHPPLRYLPVWFANILPEFYFLCLGLGALLVARALARRALDWERARGAALLTVAVVSPIGAAMALRSTLYDGVRHFLFVVPPLAALAGLALSRALSSLGRPWRLGALGLVLGSCALTAIDMARLHPYESVYFNRLVAGGLQGGAQRFETDYWGSSVRECMIWLLKHVRPIPGRKLRLSNCSEQELVQEWIDRTPGARESYEVSSLQEADLHIAITRNDCHKQPGRILHTVARNGVGLAYVIELSGRGRPSESDPQRQLLIPIDGD